jgi:ABC-type uncharacterized transport system permease subunit
MAILIHVLAAALYGIAAWARWPAAGGSSAAGAATRWMLPLALGVHAAAFVPALATPEGLDISLPNVASLVAGLVVLVCWASGFLRSLPGSGAVVLSVAAVAALLPALFRDPHRFSLAGEPWATLHIAVALTAYAILLVAALAALLMTGLEKRLHKGLPASGGDGTPPLLTLERYLFRLIATGFLLLSLTLASGALFSEQVFGRPFKLTHKSLFSLLAWLTFGALLIGRWRFGWRGRRARIWILAGASLLVLAYLGSKFVLEVLLQR